MTMTHTHTYTYATRVTIHAHAEVGATHRFPGAPTMFPQVDFLEHEHFHNFTVDAEIEVFHDDRDLEFILVSRYLARLISTDTRRDREVVQTFGAKSCESLAREWGEDLLRKYGKRWLKVTVREDGLLGASVEFRSDN